jgi:uncharacterized membrane protein YfcA
VCAAGLKEATVLSQCTIAAVSAASIIFNLPKRHPQNPDQTLIAYEVLLTMTPALLLGVALGVIFNVAFPTWLITTMLISLLAYMWTRTTQKGLQQWRSETAAKQQAAAADAEAAAAGAAAGGEGEGDSSEVGSRGDAGGSEGAGAVVVISDLPLASAGGSGKKAQLPFPWGMAAGVVFLWCGFAALQLLRQSTVKCSPGFYGAIAAQVRGGGLLWGSQQAVHMLLRGRLGHSLASCSGGQAVGALCSCDVVCCRRRSGFFMRPVHCWQCVCSHTQKGQTCPLHRPCHALRHCLHTAAHDDMQVVFGLGSSIIFAWFCLAKPARAAEGEDGLSAPLLASSSTGSLSGLLARRQHQQQADMLHLLGTILKVVLAGVVAGVVGIGGGLLMAPMLLDAGIHPQVRRTKGLLVGQTTSQAVKATAVTEGGVTHACSLSAC